MSKDSFSTVTEPNEDLVHFSNNKSWQLVTGDSSQGLALESQHPVYIFGLVTETLSPWHAPNSWHFSRALSIIIQVFGTVCQASFRKSTKGHPFKASHSKDSNLRPAILTISSNGVVMRWRHKSIPSPPPIQRAPIPLGTSTQAKPGSVALLKKEYQAKLV